jgi:transposase
MLWLVEWHTEVKSMKADWKDPGDAERLIELIAKERQAKQRDRFRVVLLAGQGLGEQRELHREQIAATVGRSRQFVDQWVGRYRSEGLAGLYARKQPGAEPKLTPEQQQELVGWLEKGPTPEEKLAAYNGPILREKIQEHFGKLYSLNGVYALLHRLGYNDLMPRTTHPDTDPAVIDSFKKRNFPKRWQQSKASTRANGS